MPTYRITWARPACSQVIQAATDADAIAAVRQSARGATGATLCRLVPGREYAESDDGMRRAGRLPDAWEYVPIL